MYFKRISNLQDVKKYLTKKNICFAVIFILFILSFCFNITFKSIRRGIRDSIRNKYYFNYEKAIWLPKKLKNKKLPTKMIQFDDIKYVKVINLDAAKDRRQHYEKMLHYYFGKTFLGKKIGDEIRFKGVYGKKDVEFVNLDTGEVWDYDKIVKKNGGKWSWQASRDVFGLDTKWMGRIKSDKNVYIKFSPMDITGLADRKHIYKNFYYAIFGKFGCHLSHLKATQEIAKLPAGSWGIILEDDFAVNGEFYKNFKENILENIPEDAEILKLVIKPHHFKNNACYKRNKANIYRSFLKKGYGKWNDLAEAELVPCSVDSTGADMVSQEGAKRIVDFYKNNFALSAYGIDYEFFWLMPKDKGIKLRSYQYLPRSRAFSLSSMSQESNIYDYGK